MSSTLLFPGLESDPKSPNGVVGNIDLKDFIPKLESFQADGIDYLYATEPQSKNLFWAGGFRESGGIDAGNDKSAGLVRPFYNAAYRIRKVDIKLPTIDYEINKYTRLPIPKEINYPQEVTIDWFEDVYSSVRGYHLAWLQRWYMREFDCWRCGAQGKYRAMRVIAFHYVNDAESGASIIEVPKIQPILAIDIAGMAPTNFGNDWIYDYSSDGNEEMLSITYKVAKINYYYSVELGDEKANFNANVSEEKEIFQNAAKAWTPVGFSQDGEHALNDKLSLENVRIVRSSTSSTSTDTALG